MTSINLSHLRKYYKKEDKLAVKDFSLSLLPQERIAIVGPSGCGKTTLLHMIAGILQPDDGAIIIDGMDVTKKKARDRNVAMVFQDQALFPHLSVEENIAFGLSYKGYTKQQIEEEVTKLLKDLHLEDVKGRKVSTLSGGQAKRVSLGRAFVRHAKILLMDEPLSSLDANLRDEFRHLILTYHQQYPCTLLYVTHDQKEAMSLATRIVVMKDGCIEQVDTPLMLYQKPKTMFVASFIGSYGMNYFKTNQENILAGIRPESFFLANGKEDGKIAAEVLYKECFGDRFLYVCKVKDIIVKALLPMLVEDSQLNLGVKKESILYFDRYTEQRQSVSLDVQL